MATIDIDIGADDESRPLGCKKGHRIGDILGCAPMAERHLGAPLALLLFETAAEAYKERVLGIILSGANSDGAEGLRAITEAGGAAIVQQPDTAEVPAMPQAALDACRDAYVADVSTIAQLLASL